MMGFDLLGFLTSAGSIFAYIIIFVFVFAESGLFIGFVLPGDTLLLTAGLLASQHFLHLSVLLVLAPVAAVLGDSLGYEIGHKVGRPIFSRPNSRFFRREFLVKAKEFYDKWGPTTIAAARFIPYMRTFVPVAAGAASMKYRTFLMFNLLGAVCWGIGMTLAGYGIGRLFGQIAGFNRFYSTVLIVGGIVCTSLAIAYAVKKYRSSAADKSA